MGNVTGNADTKVQFSLWAVLGFLCVICAILFADVYTTQRNAAAKLQEVVERKLDKVEYAEDKKEIRDALCRINILMQNQATALVVHDPRLAPYLKQSGGNN